MRSLALKLSLAFLAVGLIGAVVLALVIRQRTQIEFDQLVQTRDKSRIVEILGEYYQPNGSWTGVKRVFDRIMNLPQAQQLGIRQKMQDLVVTLADTDGKIIFSNRPVGRGRDLTAQELRSATPIEVEGEIVGLLLLQIGPSPFAPGTPERLFLANVNHAILIGAFLAVLVALLLGGFFAYTLTRTLRELTAATKRIAAGDLGYQVEVRSKDELGELASSFNQMSADLDKSNRARRQMTADIAHDLRSPLSVILGYTEALNDGKLDASPEVFEVMYKESGHLSHLIDDLRTLSLADSGELPMNLQSTNPRELLGDIASTHKLPVEKKEIKLVVDASRDLPGIMVDPNRMTQVLGNLLSNSLRYTPQGGEIVLGAGTDRGDVVLCVQDNGSGISEKDLPQIFNRFYRSDESREDNGETGLGLAIAKSLVELQGGTISVESEPDIRTAFMIRFPGETHTM